MIDDEVTKLKLTVIEQRHQIDDLKLNMRAAMAQLQATLDRVEANDIRPAKPKGQ